MTDIHMNALVDRSDSAVSPRVMREAEFFLEDSFKIGFEAWNFVKDHEKEIWRRREYRDLVTFDLMTSVTAFRHSPRMGLHNCWAF